MSELWAITSYYNPAGWQRRRQNYRHFRKHLGAPLLAVELTFGGAKPVLGAGDADILVHCADGDVMWQKERLLNHALRHLPDSCRYVAWIDCDLVFARDDWPARAKAMLDDVPVIQLFDELRHAPRDADIATIGEQAPVLIQTSVVGALKPGADPRQHVGSAGQRTQGTPAMGMAWGARRELLARHGLYDRNIVGGGDTAFAGAALGCPEVVMELHRMNAAQRATYGAWARGMHEDVQARVGFLSQPLHHLWHGDIQDRQSRQRHVRLGDHDYDPMHDLVLGSEGAWRWARHKPGLQAYVRDYFASRHEDGRA